MLEIGSPMNSGRIKTPSDLSDRSHQPALAVLGEPHSLMHFLYYDGVVLSMANQCMCSLEDLKEERKK